MTVVHDPPPPGRSDAGFTLVELLVVLVVVGVLATIAVPAFLSARREAHETAAKSDVKAITKEVLGLQVDSPSGVLDITGSGGSWQITSGATVIATGLLSEHNEVSANSFVTDDGQFCLSVRNSHIGAQFWTADDVGMRAGDCAPPPPPSP